jgi:hypothetical protein
MKTLTLAGVTALLLLTACGSTSGGGSGGGGNNNTGGTNTGSTNTGGTGGIDVQACNQSAGLSPPAGSGCATTGDTCDIACSPCHMLCGPDHTWQEACATLGCPDAAPANGDACDACSSPSACPYDLGEACSHKMATATCAGDHWEVTTPSCP